MSLFSYYLQPGSKPQRQIKPLGVADLKIKGGHESSNIFFRRKLSGKCILTGDDFEYLLDVENSGERCSSNYLVIKRNCGGGLVEHWRGVFSLTDCKWNLDKKQVELTIEPDDAYKAVLDNYSKQYNVLEVPATLTIKTQIDFKVIFQFKIIEADTLNDEQDSDTWGIFLKMRHWIDGDVFHKGVRQTDDVIFRLRKEAPFVNGQPADIGDGWKLIDVDKTRQVGKYAKAPDLYNFKPYEYGTKQDWYKYPDLIQIPCNQPYDTTKYIEVTGLNGVNSAESATGCFNMRANIGDDRFVRILWEFGTFTFSRNRRLVDVLSFLAGKMPGNIKPVTPEAVSQFLSAQTNYVTGTRNPLVDLAFAQKSDITSYSSSEVATKGMLSLKELFDELRSTFQLYWFLDTNGKLRLEHFSYFQRQGTFNLVRPEWARYLVNTRAYEYTKDKMPRYQRLTFGFAFGDDFLSSEIEYKSDCVNKLEGQDTEETSVTKFTTDLTGLLTSAGSDRNGFVLMVHRDGSVLKEQGAITGALLPNAHLAAANLQANYYQHGRVLMSGLRNDVPVTFKSINKNRKQVALRVPACCEVVDPFARYISTLTDNGELDNWTEEMHTNIVEFVLMHDAPEAGSIALGRSFDDSFDNSFG
jgi:hypothetical protein